MRANDPLRWILIKREKGIPDKPNAGDRWAVDHLILDQDGRPTLVEVKRGTNTEIRRTIVGQMLEYAAQAQRAWTADELRQTFEESSNNPDKELAELLGMDTEPDADAFWEQAATNLSASRLRLLFVSDDIPDELERIVTFLNEQMPNIEVLAVEVKRFKGQLSQTLVPRVLGRQSSSIRSTTSSPRTRLTRDTFLGQYAISAHREFVEHILESAQNAGANIDFGSKGISVRVPCEPWGNPFVTVAWLFPPERLGWLGLRNVSFGEAISDYEPGPESDLKDVIDQWVSMCADLKFGTPIRTKGIRGMTCDYGDAVQNIHELERLLREIIPRLASLKA